MRDVKDDTQGCEHRNTCPMFALFESSKQLDYWKQRYCDATYDKCARYKSMLAGETPLVHLLPSGRLLKLD